ncbi:hypothetical protein AS034_03630 [[Bacillus] enclensis]|uniref:Uncharacterized protein n=2 Tax=Rossellomorea TaxID=2837508 RepID=A0A0V8HKX8_9BACI|nr:hypothetical protein [[Bacillus] enclensis]KSU63353.1 hypothetical protein AS034_03630 [[Bacillus] enclensis]OAT83912.1 hypothetical protein A6P54_01030 [Bacillus sp. MKU004]QWC21372.1 hypothetical protein KJK41_13650 [Bacillus haikouensis]SCB82437.1 hypothetical protein GA0061094_0755 [[Bacillus] enclensis]
MNTAAYEVLLKEYSSVWKNRNLYDENQSPEQILKEAIKRELLDQNSHPRVRKPISEKYISASKRILESGLSSESKVKLLDLHIQMIDQLKG